MKNKKSVAVKVGVGAAVVALLSALTFGLVKKSKNKDE